MKLRGYLFAAATAATAVAGLTVPAQAATFGNTGITFDKDTTVNFSFQESHGRFRSDLGIQQVGAPGSFTTLFSEANPGYDSSANDWAGSCGNTVQNCDTSFKFEAGKTYSFVLTRNSGTNGVSANRVFSTNSLNSNNSKQAIFTGDLFSGGATIAFEDIGGTANGATCAAQGSNPKADCDFNDFIVTAQAESETSESVPEPATLAGLGAVAAGFVASRRRRKTA
ncbi:PEP-CTERM sorting domain-containing protein [Cyanobacteria bacterium FACHB-471]|nr:PEP-CTERM sorting domain-containing protein [Cyanobacteria bacterium FACHB-471]